MSLFNVAFSRCCFLHDAPRSVGVMLCCYEDFSRYRNKKETFVGAMYIKLENWFYIFNISDTSVCHFC